MSWYDWIWVGWILAFGILEGVGVREEYRVKGVEPLTRLVRDRWMRRPEVWLGFAIFWAWMAVHFFVQGGGLP